MPQALQQTIAAPLWQTHWAEVENVYSSSNQDGLAGLPFQLLFVCLLLGPCYGGPIGQWEHLNRLSTTMTLEPTMWRFKCAEQAGHSLKQAREELKQGRSGTILIMMHTYEQYNYND